MIKMDVDIQKILSQAPDLILTYGTKILLALAVYFVGTALAGWVSKMIGRGLAFRGVDATVASFTRHLIYYSMFAMVLVAALGQLGLQTASFVAVIGAAGLAVGLALQGSLANFAAGVLLILLRPFKSDDYVEAGGAAGSVKEISIISTTLLTPDNRTIIVPNSAIMGGNIVNYSTQEFRRVDMTVSVSYKANLDQVRKELMAVVNADERVMKDKELIIAVLELAESSVNFAVRPWVKTADYWVVKFDLMEKIKTRFDEVGIEIPFPQRTLHMLTET
jgi:small conductance mechanosensitive channel